VIFIVVIEIFKRMKFVHCEAVYGRLHVSF